MVHGVPKINFNRYGIIEMKLHKKERKHGEYYFYLT